MAITLSPEQQVWIEDRVSSGEFASTEDAVLSIIDSAMLEGTPTTDLSWAKPYVDEAIAEEERGDILTIVERDQRLEALLASLSA